MKIFLAGAYPEGLYKYYTDPAYMHRKPWKKFKKMPYLESYYEIRNNHKMVDCIRRRGDKIFLDSGAFSAFTQGVEIDLRDYAYFIKENQDIIFTASNFDVIGRGMEKESYNNQKQLESYGVRVQPVHHARDKDKWLLTYLDEGYDYIFLGGMVPESTPYLYKWLDRVWGDHLTNKKGKPKVKVHGFGLTVESLMLRYPWYSVDSTSWKMYAIMGFIIVPVIESNNNGFGRHLQSLAVSERHPAKKQKKRHYDNIPSDEKNVITDLIKGMGFKPEKLRTDRALRSVFNSRVYRKFVKKSHFPDTFHRDQISLF